MKKILKIVGVGLLALVSFGVIANWAPDTDPAAMFVKYGSEASDFVTDAEGMPIHYRDEGNPEGPAIVLLHGAGASLHTWSDMVDLLSGDYRLISLDLPGHGLTGPDPKRDYSAASLLDAVQVVMAAAGVDHAVIAGNSMGGWTAWRLALAAPEKVSGLILIDASGPQVDAELNLYLAARITESKLGQLLALKITPRAIVRKTLSQVMFDDEKITDELMDRYWELTRLPGNRQAMNDRSNVDREPEYWDRVGEINVQTLILWGEHDKTTPLVFGQAFDKEIPNSQLITYPNAAHLPMEEIPSDVARDIRAWMEVSFP